MKRLLLSALLPFSAFAAEPGEEVELSSAGAIWSSCSPDFGEQGVLDRFGQIEPVVFVSVDGYWYNGKQQNVTGKVKAVDKKTGIATVQVSEYRVTPRPKPGAFKGCL